ncbi:hypothetical protein THRCLA_21772 [Thraustotheca clavata]|uniref:Uncharacterized protein n=1 Tax=Thraustotheca clavata TaxID=74557 RepID=A0A1V9ZPT8_9STRA|nr:hypothetical protein THRCLA_21772 [Thraustotheca clavata]
MPDEDIRSRLLHLRQMEAMHDMEDQVIALRSKVMMLESREKSYINAENQLTFVVARNHELEQMLVTAMQDAGNAIDEKDRLSKKLVKVQSELGRVEEKMAKLNDDHAKALATKGKELDMINATAQVSSHTGNKIRIEADKNQLQNHITALEKQVELETQLQTSQASIKSLHNVNHQICYQLAETKHDMEKIVCENKRLAQLVDMLEKKIETFILTEAREKLGNNSLKHFQTTEIATDQMLCLYKKQLVEITYQRDRLDQELSDLKIASDLLNEKYTTCEAERTELQTTRQQLQARLETYVEDAEASMTFEKYMVLKTDNRALMQRLQALTEQTEPSAAMKSPKPPAMLRKQLSTNNPVIPPRRNNMPLPNPIPGRRAVKPLQSIPPISNQKSASWFRI